MTTGCPDEAYEFNTPTCKIQLVNLRVLSLSVDYNEVYWDVKDTAEDVFDYTFQVLRSEGSAGPWEAISPEMDDRYVFLDNKVKVGHLYRLWNYIVRVKHKLTGSIYDFGPVLKEPMPDLVATELRKHLNLLFMEFAGRMCWVLPARTWGQRCAECWDFTLRRRKRSGCVTCYDTSFVRGYHRPIQMWMQFDPVAKNEQPSPVGRLQQTSTTGKMGAFPPLKPDDLIIEPENKRWKVRSVACTEQGGAPVLQSLGLHLVPNTDMEYRVPLNLDQELKDLSFNPSRNYVNPHDLSNDQSKEIDFPLIFQLYSSGYPRIS